MPRYRDDWLIERVMFDYYLSAGGGGASCVGCGLAHTGGGSGGGGGIGGSTHLFLPNGTADLVDAVSDLDADQTRREIAELESSKNPWPRELRDQVWSDRVRVRQHMKRDMARYRAFWDEHGEACREWATADDRRGLGATPHHQRQSTRILSRAFQASRSQILRVLTERYRVDSPAYEVVLCAALEQVACFELTEYGPDGPRGSAEAEFESSLVFDRGFTLKGLVDAFEPSPDGPLAGATEDEPDSSSDIAKVMEIWFRRLQELGGPKLLEKPLRQPSDEEAAGPPPGPSFQSDRRVLRLVIARLFADQLMEAYLEETKGPPTASGAGSGALAAEPGNGAVPSLVGGARRRAAEP